MAIKSKQLDTSGIVERDAAPTLSANLNVVDKVITTGTTNGNIKLEPNGSGAIEIRGASSNDGVLQLNCSNNSHGVKIKSPLIVLQQTILLRYLMILVPMVRF